MENLVNTLLVQLKVFYEGRWCEKESGRRTNWRRVETIAQRERDALSLCLKEGCVVIEDEAAGVGQVKSSSRAGVLHDVSLRDRRCSCPDSTGLLCKHIRALAR